jgi:transcriptional regulator with XRE-family HTH domain
MAERVRELRVARGLSLDSLATCSGVSRSMISLIERGESSPTAVVLERLARGLGVTMVALFDAPTSERETAPVARRAEQPEWRDPASGYVRRNVSPPGVPQPMQLVEVHFPPGRRVAFDNGPRGRTHLPADMGSSTEPSTSPVGDERHVLHEGDCLAMQLDRPTMFRNSTRKPARYAVVIASEPLARR